MRIAALAVAALVAGCAPAPTVAPEPIQPDVFDPNAPDETRQRAEQALRVIAEAQFPGQDVSAVANCGIDNATDQEVVNLAITGSETNDFLAKATAAGVLAKPETRACLTANGIRL